jgi:hypothetical protein
MNKRRFLRKIGASELRLFGYTPALAAKKDMIECTQDGTGIPSLEKTPDAPGVNPIKAFELGQSFRMTGEKTLKAWIEENAVEINAVGIDIQGVIISKWRKHFNDEPMPDVCTFVVSGKIGKDEPEVVNSENPGVNMEE